MWYILDWTGRNMFPDMTWSDFEEAEDFLACFFEKNNMDYDEWRGEYYAQPVNQEE